jgi:tetratricopeptide (TPR) repeat protein
MKRTIFILGTALFFTWGCNNGSGVSGFDETLRQPPYRSLTDSIRANPSDASLLLKRAIRLTRNNLHDIAYYDYRKSWELQPADSTGMLFASNLFLTGRSAAAIDLLKKCIGRYPAEPEFRRRLGEAYQQAGDTRSAMNVYDSILLKDPVNFEALYEKGMLYARMKDTAHAIEILQQSYARQPVILNGLALANLYAETKNEKTLALCVELQQRDTSREFAEPVYLEGVYYANIKDNARALAKFDEAMVRDWHFIEPYIEKGIILFEEKNYDEALKTFQFATNISYTNPDNYYWIGRCYEAIGKNTEATDYYYKALTFDRDFAEAKAGLRRVKGKK